MIRFLKQETVLCAAFALAIVSMLFVHPDGEYISYVDFRTLAILFCLMSVMAGLQKIGVFQSVAQAFLSRVSKAWQLVLILVLLCFFSSMLVTNDVALITFVPFTFVVLDMIGPQAKQQLVVPVVVLQTIAANLGSMLTPIGNPQNLYLYGKAGLSLGAFVLLMLPYASAALLVILIWGLVQSRAYHGTVQVSFAGETGFSGDRARLVVYVILFVLDLLTVARVIPCAAVLGVTIAALLLADRGIFRCVDYSLLLTFVGFFIFIGNIRRLPAFSRILQQIVSGNEILAGVAASQVISNVPAALLLSGFTEDFPALIIGVNLGGLGTLIASMASLISYKLIAREEAQAKKAYFRYFTAANVCFLIILLVLAFLFRG
ncbi:MAG: citrate transporter [Oscillospiraceae bacterium]|nr:citrate transporter [Oscillospiraceae bacterium]